MIRLLLIFCCLASCMTLTAQDAKPKKKKPAPPFEWSNPISEKSLPVRTKQLTFTSSSMNIDVGYCIYLPVAYDRQPKKRFPVVYYLHGGRPGRETKSIRLIPFVHDAIKRKVIPPTIYVFVNGGPVSHYNYPSKENGMGEDIFIRELIPHIDSTYRTIADRKGRGLEGFSQGGRGTMRISLKHSNLFGSAAAGGGGYATEKRISEENGKESETLIFAEGYNTWDLARDYVKKDSEAYRLLVFVGDKGFNYQNNLEYMEFLKSIGIPFQSVVVPDAPHSATKIYETHGDDIMKFHADHFNATNR